MDSRKFFIENRNIQSVSTSFLTEKIPKFGLLITEILNQSCPKLLNNTYDGLPSKDRSTKASFCKEFDIKIENLMALFNYEFCYLVISKINVKTICLNLLRDGKFNECMNTYRFFAYPIHSAFHPHHPSTRFSIHCLYLKRCIYRFRYTA